MLHQFYSANLNLCEVAILSLALLMTLGIILYKNLNR